MISNFEKISLLHYTTLFSKMQAQAENIIVLRKISAIKAERKRIKALRKKKWIPERLFI